MADYVRAEFYKVFRRKYTYWFLLVMVACAGLLAAGFAYTNARGGSVTFGGGVRILVMLLILGIYCTLLTGDLVFSDQYKFNTLKNEVAYGISRIRIYFGKLLVSCVVAVLLCAVIISAYLGFCALLLPHDPAHDGEALAYVGFAILNALPLWLGAQAVSLLCLTFFKNSTMASMVFLVVLVLVPMGLKLLAFLIDPVFLAIREFMLVAPFDHQWVMGDWSAFGGYCAVGALWFVVCTLAGVCAFRVREIN